MARHHCVFLGGDHSVTLAAAARGPCAAWRRWRWCILTPTATPGATTLVSPRATAPGPMRRIQEGLVSPHTRVQIGLRSSGERAAREYVQDQGGLIFTARQLRGLDGAALQPVIARSGAPGRAAVLPDAGHRLPRPGLCARHRHARAGRPDQFAGADPAGRTGDLNWWAWTVSRWHPPTTTPSSPATPPRPWSGPTCAARSPNAVR